MELQIQPHEHDWQRRLPNWLTAACAGLVGGAVLMVIELAWSATGMGADPWRTSHVIAAIVLGQGVLSSATFSLGVVAAALATHYVLGLVFGLILAIIIAGFHYESNTGMVQVIGLVFGGALYILNFYGMTELFPWIAELRGWATFMGHLIFGLSVVLAYHLLPRLGVAR